MAGGDEVIRDPAGVEPILTEQCWTGHITKQHPEMAARKDLVRETIRNPDAVYLGKRDPSRRVYVKHGRRSPEGGNFLSVLVFVGNEDRYVATAHFAAEVFRQLGRQIWPTS